MLVIPAKAGTHALKLSTQVIQWRGVCLLIEERLRAGDAEDAVMQGVAAAGDLLAAHFPRIDGREDRNERPDLPQVLD